MPFEVVQYPDTSPTKPGTEVSVHWSREGVVQLEVVQHVWSHQCPNGRDGINTGCDSCPRGTTAEFDSSKVSVQPGGRLFNVPQSVDLIDQSEDVCGNLQPHPPEGQMAYRCSLPATHTATNEAHTALIDGKFVAGWGSLDTTGLAPIAPARVYTEPLSRGQINKLIRVLRRARDQAYGEDA